MADVRTQERILTCSEIKFLTPPVSPGPERSKLKTFTPPLTPTFRRRKSKSNLDLSFKSNRKENVSVFPYLEKEKKDWLLAAASNNVRIENNTYDLFFLLRKQVFPNCWILHLNLCL